jgi:hypothetical protein
MSELSRGAGYCRVEFSAARRGVVSLRTVRTSGPFIDMVFDMPAGQARQLAALLVAHADRVGEAAASTDAHANASIGAQRR